MRKVELTDCAWAKVLSMRSDDTIQPDDSHPAQAVYGAIAAARGRFVLAQVGQSLDGRVATPAGDARDISGPDGLAHLHRCRALVQAVIVGVTTVQCDDPKLSVRLAAGPDPVRVVVDCHADLDGRESLFHDGGAPVLLIQSAEAPVKSYPAEVIRLTPGPGGLPPQAILQALAARGLERVLVEGGARTIARFVEAGLVNRLHVAVSPLIIGSGPAGISLSPIEKLSSAYRPRTEVYDLGSDVLYDCHFGR